MQSIYQKAIAPSWVLACCDRTYSVSRIYEVRFSTSKSPLIRGTNGGSLCTSWHSDAARSWGASAVLGVPPMSNWRGFPHERLHQDRELL